MDLPTEYAVNDLYLASYLKARGMKLAAVQKDGRRSLFVFRDAPERSRFVSDYTNDVPIGVSSFIHALKDLKAAIHTWDGPSPARETDVHKRWR